MRTYKEDIHAAINLHLLMYDEELKDVFGFTERQFADVKRRDAGHYTSINSPKNKELRGVTRGRPLDLAPKTVRAISRLNENGYSFNTMAYVMEMDASSLSKAVKKFNER